jgi:L-proline amide hydrolase
MQAFYERYFCRIKPFPKVLNDSFAVMTEDLNVYNTMCFPIYFHAIFKLLKSNRHGTSEFAVSGTLKPWTIENELHKINVSTLLINVKYDPAWDQVMQLFFNTIENVKWARFVESSHVPQFEEPEELKVLTDFLLVEDS